jgi:hypothetical protein
MEDVIEINWREVVAYLDANPDKQFDYVDLCGRGLGCLMYNFFNFKFPDRPVKPDHSGMNCFDKEDLDNKNKIATIVDAPIQAIGEIHNGTNSSKGLRRAAKGAWKRMLFKTRVSKLLK